MIQRLQSLFYLLASATILLEFIFPFAKSSSNTSKYFEDFVYNIHDHFLLIGLTIAGSALAFMNIFAFKNRSLQIRIGYLSIILFISIAVLALILILTEGNPVGVNEKITEQVGIGLPIVAVIFAALGNKYVKKDLNVVKSMDRLR